MNILIVDAHKDIASLMQDFLRTQKHRVRVAYTADQAIALCDERRPDCIVLELALGQHSGVEFLHEFRSYGDWKNVPVVVFTMVDIQKQDVLKKLGVNHYLYKPKSSLKELASVLQRMTS